MAVGMFNLGDESTEYILDLNRITDHKDILIRDLWRQKDLGKFSDSFITLIPSHGVVLIMLAAIK